MIRLLTLLRCILFVGLFGLALPGHADGINLSQLSTQRVDDGLELSFTTHFDLPAEVEHALHNGFLPIYFVVEVSVYRHRWYWRDTLVAKASRTWRLDWQPLTSKYRVSTGGLTQSFATLNEALTTMRSVGGWRIGDAKDFEPDAQQYLEFSYKLDTSQLPKPMQIGLSEPHGWALSVERTISLNPDFSPRAAP